MDLERTKQCLRKYTNASTAENNSISNTNGYYITISTKASQLRAQPRVLSVSQMWMSALVYAISAERFSQVAGL